MPWTGARRMGAPSSILMRVVFPMTCRLPTAMPPRSALFWHVRLVHESSRQCHRREDTKIASAAAGHALEYLPAYSPEVNEIKNKRAEAKAYRRRNGKTVDEISARKNSKQNRAARLYFGNHSYPGVTMLGETCCSHRFCPAGMDQLARSPSNAGEIGPSGVSLNVNAGQIRIVSANRSASDRGAVLAVVRCDPSVADSE